MKHENIHEKVEVYDIETYSNLFTVVFYNPRNDIYTDYVIHDLRDDRLELIKFIKTRPSLVGYNNLAFDAQVIEAIMRGQVETAEEIYAFVQDMIQRVKLDRWDLPFKEWDLRTTNLDLMTLNHYGLGTAKTTSLKHLCFTMRYPSMADLPYEHTAEIKTQKQIDDIIKYNYKDVESTFLFYLECEQAIDLRKGIFEEYGEKRIINMSDSSIASFMLKKILSKELGVSEKELKKRKTNRDKIEVAPLLRDYINFNNQCFKDAHNHFKSKVIYKDPKTGEISLKGKDVLGFSTEFQGLEYEYGAGGLHACIAPQIIEPTDNQLLIDIDFSSYYPWLAITGGVYPEHLSPKFTNILENLYYERKKHKKGTVKNHSIKIVLNSIYGLFNNKYSVVYDPQCTINTTVNGQLLLSMLCDRLSELGQIIQVNTDGLTILIEKKDVELFRECYKSFEKLSGLMLEEVIYSKMIIRDVNNYISVTTDGSIKRKGFFETYEDIIGNYHKNPSASIIPHALSEYFLNSVDVETTIRNHNNIHDFLYGIKKRSNFEYIGLKCDDKIIEKIERKKFEGRVVRYYISNDGYNVYKHFLDGRKNNLQVVNKGCLVTPAPTIQRSEVFYGQESPKAKRGEIRWKDINYDWYINEANKIINLIEERV